MSRLEANLLILDELQALGMVITRHLAAGIVTAPEKSYRGFANAYDRVSLGIRRCMLLGQWLEAGAPPPPNKRPSKPKPATAADAAPQRRRLTGSINLERVERLDFGPNPEAALEDGRVDAAIDSIRQLFGITPGRHDPPETLAARLVAAFHGKPVTTTTTHRLSHPPDR